MTALFSAIVVVHLASLATAHPSSLVARLEGRFYVVGQVHAPGEYPYEEGLTAGVAIEKAGGSRGTGRYQILVTRAVEGKTVRIPASDDTPLIAGDTVIVGECDVTLPPATPFVPPARYRGRPLSQHRFWFGSDRLWVSLDEDGVWRGSKGESGVRNLVWWWRNGDEWRRDTRPQLRVSASRVGGGDEGAEVSRVTAGDFSGGPAMGVMITLRPGCWQIRGRFKDDTLTFVVLVQPE